MGSNEIERAFHGGGKGCWGIQRVRRKNTERKTVGSRWNISHVNRIYSFRRATTDGVSGKLVPSIVVNIFYSFYLYILFNVFLYSVHCVGMFYSLYICIFHLEHRYVLSWNQHRFYRYWIIYSTYKIKMNESRLSHFDIQHLQLVFPFKIVFKIKEMWEGNFFHTLLVMKHWPPEYIPVIGVAC